MVVIAVVDVSFLKKIHEEKIDDCCGCVLALRLARVTPARVRASKLMMNEVKVGT